MKGVDEILESGFTEGVMHRHAGENYLKVSRRVHRVRDSVKDRAYELLAKAQLERLRNPGGVS